MRSSRRHFFKTSAATAAGIGLGDLGFLCQLPHLSAAETTIAPNVVRFSPDIEPLVRLIEDTPRERLLEEVASRISRGLSYREVLAGLLLAGIRNIQPRPVGFKFHSVLVVNSAHLASISSPDSDRWLPLFWALDYFKTAQAQDAREGDWTMSAPVDSRIPSSAKARTAFIEAMDHWDEPAADMAICGLARTAVAQEIFETLCRFGARDFRDIGHKAIYVANAWRTLQVIGWHHAEPVLRSLAYALLDRSGGPNPAKADLPPDRPWKRNQALATTIRPDWLEGQPSSSATADLLEALRKASAEESSAKVAELLNGGVAPQSIWDAVFVGAGELLARRPGIISLHAVTSANALHFMFQTTANADTRRLLLLQSAAFMTLFRGDGTGLKPMKLDELQPAGTDSKPPTIDEIFADISEDRWRASGKTLGWLKHNPNPMPFITAARRLVFLKGTNSHDYKFSSAVLEDYPHISPRWRDHFLAASVFNLRGSGDADNSLVHRTRSALGT